MSAGGSRLSGNDIRAKLEDLYRSARDHHVFAFLGEGSDEEIRLNDGRPFRVVPVKSELELRDELSRSSPDENLVYLVPFEHDIPDDVRGRFANNGRVHRIGKELRLAQMFGVKEVESDARHDPLVPYLLRAYPDRRFSIALGVLTRDAMWEAYLDSAIELGRPGGLTLAVLLAFVARDARGPAFVKDLEAKGEGDIVRLVRDYATSKLGDVGGYVLDAWFAGRGAAALELAILAEAIVETSEPANWLWLRMQIKAELGVGDATTANAIASGLAAETSGAMLLRARDDERGVERHKLVVAAEARADEPAIRAALAASHRLPCAFRARLDVLGAALSRGAVAPTAASFADACDAFERLKRHDQAGDGSEAQTLARAESALRLLGFLATRPAEAAEPPLKAYGDAESLAQWYVEEGGFVDWERYRARGHDSDPFGVGARDVVAAVDTLRRSLDRRFAVALAKWIEAGRPAQSLIPIDAALDRLAVPLLEASAERSLLVLLIDGMAWTQAVELLRALGRGAECTPWSPLAFRGWAKPGSATMPVVAAALPTITEVSRAAFFAGQPVADGSSESTSKDPERFRQHRALAKLCPGTSAPKLMLQGDAFAADGHLAEPARTMILDKNARVVGVVVNAIDDSLKASPQQDRRWSIDVIKSLRDILGLAQESGRTILLASDHGHVPSDRLATMKASSAGGARYRAWDSESAAVAPNELAFKGAGVRTPKGAAGVVLPIDDTVRYTSAVHAGEHGGATLAEVVAPTLLLGCEHDVDANDVTTTVIPFPTPRWWHLQVEPVAKSVEPPTARPSKKKLSSSQLTLPAIPAVEAPKPLAVTREDRATPLLESPLFAARAPKGSKERDDALRSVSVLLAKPGGVVDAEVFASELGMPSFRVSGFVSGLSAVLNVDGYQVISFEPSAKLVRLDREKLAAQFDVRFGVGR